MADSFLPPVVAVLTANISEFSAKMTQAKGEMAEVEGTAGTMGVAGKTALLGLAAGAIAVGAESVKMASSFQSTMELIATQAHAGQQEVDAMSKAVLDLAPTVGIGPEKLAEGLYHVESTGLRGQAALDVLKASAQEAALGMADFDSVTYAMSGVMSIAMGDVKNAADGVAYLNTIVGTGDMRMQDLANAIGTGVLPVFKTAGLGMRDFGAALTVMTDNAMPADQAANHLKTAVQLLQNQSGPAAKALASIGIESGQLANDLRQPNGFLVAIEDIKTHLEESGKTAAEQGQIISKAFGGARSAATIEEMVAEVDKLKGKYTEMGTVAQREQQQQQDWANTQATFKQRMAEVGAQFQVWAIQIGQVLLPVLSTLADWFMNSVRFIGAHKEILIAVASAAIPLLVMGLWSLVTATVAWTVALLANPITWIVLAFAALGVAIYELIQHWNAVKAALAPFANWFNQTVIQPVVRVVQQLWAQIQPHVMSVVNGIRDAWNTVSQWTRDHWTLIQAIIDAVWQVIKPLVQAYMNDVVGTIRAGWQIIVDVFQTAARVVGDIINGVIDFFRGLIREGKGIIEFFAGVFTGNWRAAWNGLKDIVGGAWDNIRAVFGTIVNVGRDIVTGLWNGISAMGSWLWNKVTSWASGILNSIKGALGIASPSRETFEHGRFLAEGLANGILANAHLATGAAAVMASRVLGATAGMGAEFGVGGSASALTAGAGATSGQAVQINITMNPRDVQRFIQEGTLRYNFRNTSNGMSVGVA